MPRLHLYGQCGEGDKKLVHYMLSCSDMPFPFTCRGDYVSTAAGRERRSQYRFPVTLQLQCRRISADGLRSHTGCADDYGETVDFSSRGVRFRVNSALDRDAIVQLAIAWPAPLDDGTALKMVVLGRVLRSDDHGTAVRMMSHEFRVAGGNSPERERAGADIGHGGGSGGVAKAIGPATASKKAPGPWTVLVVDDDEDVRNVVEAILSRMGLRTLRARGGRQALMKLRAHSARIDLLLSDVQMGPEMSGIELASQVRLERPNAKILLMSGGGVEPEIQAAGWEFIRKPFLPEVLQHKVERLLAD